MSLERRQGEMEASHGERERGRENEKRMGVFQVEALQERSDVLRCTMGRTIPQFMVPSCYEMNV